MENDNRAGSDPVSEEIPQGAAPICVRSSSLDPYLEYLDDDRIDRDPQKPYVDRPRLSLVPDQ